MRELPTIKGHRTSSAPSFPERFYVYRGDQPFVPPIAPPPGHECLADDCSKKRHSSTYCERHYRNFKLYGTPHMPDRRRKENRNASSSS